MTFIMSYTLSYFDVPMEGWLAMSDTWDLDDDELPPEWERLQILSPEVYELLWGIYHGFLPLTGISFST